jgi:hypothetical protein
MVGVCSLHEPLSTPTTPFILSDFQNTLSGQSQRGQTPDRDHPLPYSDRSCTEEHEAHQALRTHHQEWFSYLYYHPDEIIELETSRRNYIVRYQKPINEEDSPLIFIQTYAPWHGTPTEGYGFAYFSGDTIENSAFGGQVFRQLQDNIFCYYPTSAATK